MAGINKLTDRGIKAFIGKSKADKAFGAKLFDGGGLFLTVTPAGSAVWRIKYRLGKEKLYTIGAYPEIGLEAARIERGTVREDVKAGRDPVRKRQVRRAEASAAAEDTFGALADDWLEKQRASWSATHYQKTKQALDRDMRPALGALPVNSITPAMVASAAEAIVRRGARETAAKALWTCKGVFELGQARGLCRDNPAIPARAVLPRKPKEKHLPALRDWAQLGSILHRAQIVNMTRSVHMAHRLIAFTLARIGNIVAAEWPEFHLDAAVPMWVIPRNKMKVDRRDFDHKILLPPSIVDELRVWKRSIGSDRYLFPSPAGKNPHIGRESVEKAYRVTLGLEDRHTPHGWRSSFSTLARDHGFAHDVVELALDHVHSNEVARAYDRGERLSQRAKLAEWWGAQLVEAERSAAEAS